MAATAPMMPTGLAKAMVSVSSLISIKRLFAIRSPTLSHCNGAPLKTQFVAISHVPRL